MPRWMMCQVLRTSFLLLLEEQNRDRKIDRGYDREREDAGPDRRHAERLGERADADRLEVGAREDFGGKARSAGQRGGGNEHPGELDGGEDGDDRRGEDG